jgi:hypothetical protein
MPQEDSQGEPCKHCAAVAGRRAWLLERGGAAGRLAVEEETIAPPGTEPRPTSRGAARKTVGATA